MRPETLRLLPGIVAMAVLVVISNILVQFLLGDFLTWGAFTYPFTFLVTDLMNRLYGPQAARKVVFAGFVAGVACSLIGSQIQGEFGPLVTFRVALGSGLAFLVGQLADVEVFRRYLRRIWWKAPFISSGVGSTIDTAIFFTVAFSAGLSFLDPGTDVAWANAPVPLLGLGPEVPLWVSLACADWGVKMLIDLVALLPFRIIIFGRLAKTARAG